MITSPRLLFVLLMALLSASAGCSSSADGVQADSKEYQAAITPKPYIDDNAAERTADMIADAYHGEAETGADYRGWSREEIAAASFIHSSNVYFHFDSAELTADAKDVLRQKAARMKAFPQLHTLIAGHSDERGSESYNLRLGQRRADAAYKYLISLGVPAAQISATSYGKSYPLSSGSDEKAWSRNRRDEFTVTKP